MILYQSDRGSITCQDDGGRGYARTRARLTSYKRKKQGVTDRKDGSLVKPRINCGHCHMEWNTFHRFVLFINTIKLMPGFSSTGISFLIDIFA